MPLDASIFDVYQTDPINYYIRSKRKSLDASKITDVQKKFAHEHMARFSAGLFNDLKSCTDEEKLNDKGFIKARRIAFLLDYIIENQYQKLAVPILCRYNLLRKLGQK